MFCVVIPGWVRQFFKWESLIGIPTDFSKEVSIPLKAKLD